MAFIREMVAAKPEIEFEALVKAVRKAGYATMESSIKVEFFKTLRKLGKPAKAKKPVKKKPEPKKAIVLSAARAASKALRSSRAFFDGEEGRQISCRLFFCLLKISMKNQGTIWDRL